LANIASNKYTQKFATSCQFCGMRAAVACVLDQSDCLVPPIDVISMIQD
jgi:hypothetical protein